MVLGAGSHTINAQYSGDANYAAATSTSSVIQQIGKAPSTTTLSGFSAVLLPSESGLVATVADAQAPSGGPYHFYVMGASGLADGNPTGTVQFFSGGTAVGTGTLAPNYSANVASTASLNTNNITGTSFSATYPGDANFQGSASEVMTQQVDPSTTVTLSPTALSFGNQAINTTSAAKTVTLTNTGTAPLIIGSVAAYASVIHAGSISLTPSGNSTTMRDWRSSWRPTMQAMATGRSFLLPSTKSTK